MKRNKPTYWLYFLGAYVLIQFIWWGYHLIQLSAYIPNQDTQLSKRIGMILGEGAVFLFILVFGIYRIRRSIGKEFFFQQQQQNFLLTITHELKTPIAALKLYLQTLKKHQLPADKQQEILNGALQENARLSALIENILSAAKAENKEFQIHKQKTELVQFCKQIIDRYHTRLQSERIKLVGPSELFCQIDQNIFETILENLIDNAFKYGGEDQQISIQIEQLDRFTTIKVADNGPGIAPQQRTQIFEKFFRVGSEETRKQPGSGLGLYIVWEFVKLHQGSIRYLANQPQGSIFEIILPL